MKKLMYVLFILSFAAASAQDGQRFINVNGTSELILIADQINITVQIRTIDNSIEQSKKANDTHLNELLAILKGTSISSDDIEATPVMIGKNYEYTDRERKLKGFFTEIKVSFLLKDLSKYYQLINKISENNIFEIVSSYYSISDYESQHRKAYEEALRAAKNKAEYMANTLEVALAGVLEIDEGSSGYIYPTPYNLRSEDAGSPDVTGKVTIRRSIRVKFAIK
jgi:uncharacterized protein